MDSQQEIQLFEIIYHYNERTRLIIAFDSLTQAEILIKDFLPDFSKVAKSEIKGPYISINTPTYDEGVMFQMFFCRTND